VDALGEADVPVDVHASDRPVAMVVAVTPLFEMSWGKQAAQCAHAAQVLWREADADVIARWHDSGRQVRVLHPTDEVWADAVNGSYIQIRDGGFTEIPAGTMSSVAWWAVTDAIATVECSQHSD